MLPSLDAWNHASALCHRAGRSVACGVACTKGGVLEEGLNWAWLCARAQQKPGASEGGLSRCVGTSCTHMLTSVVHKLIQGPREATRLLHEKTVNDFARVHA